MATVAPPPPGAATPKPERIGLLFVHGIGQQKRFDHLTQSVSQIAELMNRGSKRSVNVVDRTVGWKAPVDEPSAAGQAPVTLTVTDHTKVHVFECHEVFWADLGGPSGLKATVRFWFWALGQWCAPIYFVNDAAQLSKENLDVKGSGINRPVSQLARLPNSVAGNVTGEIMARLKLGLAGLAALLTLASWTLLKRLFAAVLNTTPAPSLIVDYVDKVRCYEDSAHPGDTALSDPGFPRRVGIRRRMIAQMVAMGARSDIDRWYVLAHSLGSVVAYNGLGEIGHTLPNYLGEHQWHALPFAFKRDPGCRKRPADQIEFMMPARPAWLHDDDLVNREALFSRLRGFITYGSPLEKFAAIWPRIIATATDRQFDDDHLELTIGKENITPKSVFPPDCQWINLRAPLDPVAGGLKSFIAPPIKIGSPAPAPFFGKYFPTPTTYTTSFWQMYLLAHLQYFKNAEAYIHDQAVIFREAIVDWLIDPATPIKPIETMDWQRSLGALGIALLLIAALAVAATASVVAAGGISWHLLSATAPLKMTLGKYLCAIGSGFAPVLSVALGLQLIAGFWRWIGESRVNLQLTLAADQSDRKKLNGAVRQMAPERGLDPVIGLQRRQLKAAWISLVLSAIILGLVSFFCLYFLIKFGNWIILACVFALLFFAVARQALVNKSLGPLQLAPQSSDPSAANKP